jgi:hypothetical protein
MSGGDKFLTKGLGAVKPEAAITMLPSTDCAR